MKAAQDNSTTLHSFTAHVLSNTLMTPMQGVHENYGREKLRKLFDISWKGEINL